MSWSLCSMYHQPIKLPFSKLCKSVESRLRLTTTLIHQIEPVLLFKTLFSSTFKAIYNLFSFYFDNDNAWNKHFWKLKTFCLFWKANLSNRVHSNETCMSESMLMSISICVTSRFFPRIVCGQWQEWKKTEWKCMKMNRLAKLKTRKGGLGKNEHPAGLKTRKGSSGKNGALKKTYFPGGSKTRKGDPGKNGMQQKWKIEKMICKKHWPQMQHPQYTQH